MHRDVIDLRNFYNRTVLGAHAGATLAAALRELWPDLRGQVVAGYGYPVPVLDGAGDQGPPHLALMPSEQGVCRWPKRGRNRTVLVDPDRLPLPVGSVDRLVVLHGYETTPRPQDLMRELYRVLAPGGRVVFMVPNRTGLWARSDAVPFGSGHPFTAGQLRRLLRESGFEPLADSAVLFMPPTHRRFWLRGARAFERVGNRLGLQRLAGVLLVEAGKLVYVPPRRHPEPVRELVGVLGDIAPAPRPVAGRSA